MIAANVESVTVTTRGDRTRPDVELVETWLGLLREQMNAVAVTGWQVGVSGLLCVLWMAVGQRLVRRLPQRLMSSVSMSRDALWTDLTYACLGPATSLLALSVVATGLAPLVTLIGATSKTYLSGFGPVMSQPSWLILAEMFLIADLFAYWSHRLSHRVPWLWRFHAVHHSSQQVTFLSAARAHPLNQAFTQVVNTLPLFCLGFPVAGLLAYTPVVGLAALLIHSNVNWGPRPLALLVTTPRYHRFHHTLTHEGGDRNFAGLFPVFDLLFGTYHLPETMPDNFGLDRGPMPEDPWAQCASPFRLDESLSPSSPTSTAAPVDTAVTA